jgi:mono/diheme cytochrome c family protein
MFVIATASIIWSTGCGSARRDEPFTKPLVVDHDPKLVIGQKAFARNCNECHPGGSGGEGPALNDSALPASFIKFQVRNGLGAMPAFSTKDVSDSDLDALVFYVQALRKLN